MSSPGEDRSAQRDFLARAAAARAAMQTHAPDARIADAIDRVLEAEHATLAAIAEAQTAAQASIEAAREARRIILEKARKRILQLHQRAQRRLDDTLRALDARAASPGADHSSLADLTEAAVARVATNLTTDTPA
jgi:regulator of protease activity HflC (stomatin/prohibitin superfamily)